MDGENIRRACFRRESRKFRPSRDRRSVSHVVNNRSASEGAREESPLREVDAIFTGLCK